MSRYQLNCNHRPAVFGSYCLDCGLVLDPQGAERTCECGHARRRHVGDLGRCVSSGEDCSSAEFVLHVLPPT